MSFKRKFLDLDVQTLASKKRRLIATFESDPSEITDTHLDIYNLLTKRIQELTEQI